MHACVILWKTAFEELRGLTNKKSIQDSGVGLTNKKSIQDSGVGLNPMELNDLYDHLWNMGSLLQTEDALDVIEDLYRPWPRCRYNEGPSKLYYTHLEKHKEAERAELRAFQTKSDIEIYNLF